MIDFKSHIPLMHIVLALIILAVGSYQNLERLIGNHKFVTRFLCSKSFQQCMTFEKPGFGLGVFVTLRQHYKNAVLVARNPKLISGFHLLKLSGITLQLDESLDFDLEKIRSEFPNRALRFEYRPKAYLPREQGDVEVGHAEFVTLFIHDRPSKNEILYLMESDNEYYIVPGSLIDSLKEGPG